MGSLLSRVVFMEKLFIQFWKSEMYQNNYKNYIYLKRSQIKTQPKIKLPNVNIHNIKTTQLFSCLLIDIYRILIMLNQHTVHML